MLKAHRDERKSEGFIVPTKVRKTCRREGALLWLSLWGGKRESMTERSKDSVDKVRELQRKLWMCAKRSKTRRFHALYDRIYRSDVLCGAVWPAGKTDPVRR